jgi:hypothetical protein
MVTVTWMIYITYYIIITRMIYIKLVTKCCKSSCLSFVLENKTHSMVAVRCAFIPINHTSIPMVAVCSMGG